MVATTDHNAPAHGASRRRRGALRAWMAGFLDWLRAERQRAVSRRLIEELPDHLLKDMGISRAAIGVPHPADPTAARTIRHFAEWR